MLCFLDMVGDGVHQLLEAWITRHVVRSTCPQFGHQSHDSVVFHTRCLAQRCSLYICLLGNSRGKHGCFQERIEFQGDQHLGGHLLSQVRIMAVLIGLEESPDPLMIGFQRGHLSLAHPRDSFCGDMAGLKLSKCKLQLEVEIGTMFVSHEQAGEVWDGNTALPALCRRSSSCVKEVVPYAVRHARSHLSMIASVRKENLLTLTVPTTNFSNEIVPSLGSRAVP